LTDDLINALTKIQGLRVVARSSAFQFKDKARDIRSVGRQVGVGTVLEGSVRKSGGRLRIAAQLNNAADGYHLWSETYDRELKDVFAVQDEITRAIAHALEIQLSSGSGRRLVKTSTGNLEAYNLYLQGRYYWGRWRREGATKGIEYFQQAIAKDANYAPAYSGLADSLGWLGFAGVLPPTEAMPKAREAALKAARLDDTLAAAHISLGYVKSLYDRDWPGAEREFRRALDLNPGYADAHFAYGLTYLAPLGRLNEALAEIQRARDLDPLSLIINTYVGLTFYLNRQYDRAIEHCRKALELDPTFLEAYAIMSNAYLAKGMFPEAYAAIEKMRSISPDARPEGILAYAYALQGRRDEARSLLRQWTVPAQQQCLRSTLIACVYAGLGEKDRVFEFLNKAADERDGHVIYVNTWPAYDSLHGDPRFSAFLAKIGLSR
jgi:serine/threonine-protein kinase